MDSRQYEKALAACDQLLFLSSSPWLVASITAFASPPTADRRFEAHSAKALAEMWREFPEFAMGVGNYKYADRKTVPNITQRKQSFAFYNRQLAALAKFDASKLCERHTSREAFVDTIRQQIPRLEKFVREKDWVDLNPTRPLVVHETPLYMRGGGAGASVSAPGPYDPQANTYYNVTPLDEFTPSQAESHLREYTEWTLQILNIPEAVPGHYTQLVHANKSKSVVKAIFGNGSMIEGWAMHSEKVMLDAGYGDNAPEMWLCTSARLCRAGPDRAL